MKNYRRFYALAFIFTAFLTAGVLVGIRALADGTPTDPTTDFLTQMLDLFKNFGGLAWYAKVSGVIMLVVASMKVSFLNNLIWSKLGALQTWLAPALGLVAGIVSLASGGQPITLAAIMLYVSTGVGAIGLHELLDTVKAIPGLGALWVSVINVIESALGGPASQPQLKK